MRDVVILGSTGSIGSQALDVIEQQAGQFRVLALAAGGSNLPLLARQALSTGAQVVAVAQGQLVDIKAAFRQVQEEFGIAGELPEVLVGMEAVEEVAGRFPEAVVLNGIAGGIGLRSSLNALRCGATLALANKESLVVGGPLIKAAMMRPGQVVPVDSEHSAILQALRSGVHEKGLCSPNVTGKSELSQIIITASGGPFRGRKRKHLQQVSPDQALAHPTWQMGPLVTINSSTLVNKGLEVIEAALLFDVPASQIQAVVHPQSVIHSMVCWQDGSTVAQASPPDMRLPIALGLSWPNRLEKVAASCRWDQPVAWTFEPIDTETFPAVELARYALETSQTHPAVFNSANEVLVEAFIQHKIGYLDIVDTLIKVVEEHLGVKQPTLEDILEVQSWARQRVSEVITGL